MSKSQQNRNTEGLIPFTRGESEASEKGRIGGKRSGEARREKKRLSELLEAALQTVMKDRDGNTIKSPDDPRRNLTRKEAGMIKMAAKFANGDLKTIELAAKLTGELVQQVEVSADVAGGVVMGFDPNEAIREIYGRKEGGNE